MHYTVKRLVVGELATNCYIIKQGESRNAVVIDPGDDAILIKSTLLDMDAYPAVILLTHGHFDHILALDELRAEKTVVCIHEKDAVKLAEKELIAAWARYSPWPFKKADVLFGNGNSHVSIGGFDFEVIHTPGHSEGSVCYRFGDLLFTGDTLFKNGIGRVDFDGGDAEKMAASLRMLYNMPGDYAVYPGHEGDSTLSEERIHNPYMREVIKK